MATVVCRAWLGVLPLLVAACAASGVALPTLEPPAPGVVEVCPEALLGPATLEERPNQPSAPVVAVSRTGETVPLIWSRDFSATFSPLVVRGPEGEIAARGGDTVWLTGGAAEGGGYYVCGVSTSPPD